MLNIASLVFRSLYLRFIFTFHLDVYLTIFLFKYSAYFLKIKFIYFYVTNNKSNIRCFIINNIFQFNFFLPHFWRHIYFNLENYFYNIK